jgi:hypothetical protein
MRWLYKRGVILEGRQFLRGKEVANGQTVDKKVKDEYGDYARQVRYRWVLSIFFEYERDWASRGGTYSTRHVFYLNS